MAVQPGGDAVTAVIFIHTQVVDIQLPSLGGDAASRVGLQYAKGIACHMAIGCRHENGAILLLQQGKQGGFIIFQRAGGENIRPQPVVDLAHLQQQLKKIGNIRRSGKTNGHNGVISWWLV